MYDNKNKNNVPPVESDELSHNNDPSADIDVLVEQADKILVQARDIRRAFLHEALAKGLTEKEILQAAMEAFNARRLPRIAFGLRSRGSGYVVAGLFGKAIPEDEVYATISKDTDGNPVSLVFDVDDMAFLPERTDTTGEDDYSAHLVLMPQVDKPAGTSEEWRDHVANLEEALSIEQ